MAFKQTTWEYSDEVDATSIPPEAGERYLQIRNATFDKSSFEYNITFCDLSNNAEFTLRYWISRADDNGNIVPSTRQRGTLISLGTALAGKPVGIPAPQDIIGGVVVGTVQFKEGSQYPRVYKYFPAPKDIVDGFSSIDQCTAEDCAQQ